MKSIKILALIAIYFSVTSFTPITKPTEELKWMGFNEGYELAVKKKKIALLDCYTDWCGWCKVMDKETYSKEAIQKKIYANFVPIKINPELDQMYKLDGKEYSGPQLLAYLSNNSLSGYPTVIFIIPNGNSKTIEMSVGYSDAAKFSQILDEKSAKLKK